MTFIIAAGIFFAAGVVQGLTGFGSALVAIPLLAFIVDIKLAVPLCMLNGLIITGYLALRLRQHLSRKRILPLFIGSLPGVLVGATLLTQVDSTVIRRLIGILLIFYGSYSLLIKPRSLRLRPFWGYIAGFFTGAIGAAFSAGGPPAIIYTSLTDWKKEEIKATLTGFFIVNGLITAAVHGLTGMTTVDVLRYFSVTAPLVLCGTIIGSRLTDKISRQQYIRLIFVFLIIMGMMMFV